MVYSLKNIAKARVLKYNAIPGIIAQDITTWGQMREVLRELKKPEVQNTFKTVIVDTVGN